MQLLLSTSNPCIQEGFDDHLGVYRHCLYSGCSDETDYLLRLRDNICYYAQIIDTYAPCIVGSSKWNNDVNMDFHCATPNKKVWNRKILSISDETFILLCLISYGKRWFAEFVKADKLVSKTCIHFAHTRQQHPTYINYSSCDILRQTEKEDMDRGGRRKPSRKCPNIRMNDDNAHCKEGILTPNASLQLFLSSHRVIRTAPGPRDPRQAVVGQQRE